MLETFKFTLRIMGRRPLRSLLTVFQLGLGVWIVAVILSLNLQAAGLGDSKQSLDQTLAKLTISKQEEIEGGGMMMAATSNFRLKDLEKLGESENIETAFIYSTGWEQNILVDNLAYRISVIAEVSPEYAGAVSLKLMEGEFFTPQDLQQGNRVLLISEVIKKQLFPQSSALGAQIELAGYGQAGSKYEIIGVYKRPDPALEFFLPESFLLLPLGFSVIPGISSGEISPREAERSYGEIYLKAKGGKLYEAVADAEILLAERAVDDLQVRGEYFADSYFLGDQIQQLALFLGAFAFMAILISAIGILSIMLVSVVERTREIGLRQALGASKGVIVGQILNESFVFSLLGAFVGLTAAFFSADSLATLLVQELTFQKLDSFGGLHPQAALISLGLAVAVGLLFGLYPALQAAKMPPVEALRDV